MHIVRLISTKIRLISLKTMDKDGLDTFLVNIDYCGTCYGTCRGCLLDEQERKSTESFLSVNQLIEAFVKIKDTRPNAINSNYSSLAFGRGNTLSLSDKTWFDIKESSNKFKEVFLPKKFNIECSTSLIGKIDKSIDIAKRRVDDLGQMLRFVIAANSDLYSKSYWDNLDLFFKSMMDFRGGKDTEESGDILVLNLVADHLPPVVELVDRIKDYPFPVNIAWLPLSKQSNDEANILSNGWLNDFYQESIKYGLDSNFSRFFSSKKNAIPIYDALEKLNSNLQNFWWIEKDGNISNGLFTPMGDVDFSRLEKKLLLPIERSPINIFKQLKRREFCKNCQYQSVCLQSGLAVYAIASKNNCRLCPIGIC